MKIRTYSSKARSTLINESTLENKFEVDFYFLIRAMPPLFTSTKSSHKEVTFLTSIFAFGSEVYSKTTVVLLKV